MMRMCNEMLRRTLQLAEIMVELADQGEGAREDIGCGVLYGLLRDSAYKIRKVAEQEKEDHIRRGVWPEENMSPEAESCQGELRPALKKIQTKFNQEDQNGIQSQITNGDESTSGLCGRVAGKP
jgi:hypothetical protein